MKQVSASSHQTSNFKISMIICFIVASTSTLIICGNFWYFENQVLAEIKKDYPDVTGIIDKKINWLSKSIFTVNKGNEKIDFCLDSSIDYKYEISKCED